MVVKEEQERVRALLTDTITLLCRNGLTYKSEFNISALIGITLDKDDVVLVDIRETIKNSPDEDAPEESAPESEEEPPTKRSRKRRKMRRSSQTSNEEISLADKQFEQVHLKAEPSHDDDDDADIVFIKDEPRDSLDSSSMDMAQLTQPQFPGSIQQHPATFPNPYSMSGATSSTAGTVNMSWDQSSNQQQLPLNSPGGSNTVPTNQSWLDTSIKGEDSSVEENWNIPEGNMSTDPDSLDAGRAISNIVEGIMKNKPGGTVFPQMENNEDGTLPAAGDLPILPSQTPKGKKTYKSYSVAHKLNVVQWHKENGQCISKTARQFTVANKCVRLWVQSEALLEEAARSTGNAQGIKRLVGDPHPLSKELDDEVMEWYYKEKMAGKEVTTEDIQTMAKHVGEQKGLTGFKASTGWLRRWKKRNSDMISKLE